MQANAVVCVCFANSCLFITVSMDWIRDNREYRNIEEEYWKGISAEHIRRSGKRTGGGWM